MKKMGALLILSKGKGTGKLCFLNAYLDNETGKPKLNPGQCRILNENLNAPFIDSVIASQESPFNRVKGVGKISRNNQYLYFYWMIQNPVEIQEFKIKYKNAYNLKYRGMLEVLKSFAQNEH